MRIVIIHTDFRIYWPARIYALQQLLKDNRMSLYIIEIAGAGSPYSFSNKNTDHNIDNWNILFPNSKIEELSMSKVKQAIISKLDEINPDIVIAGAIAFPSGAVSSLWCRKNKKKLIIFDDAKINDVKRGTFVNFIKRRIYHNVDAMLYPAKEWDETGFYWGFKKEQLFYGLDVVDNEFWKRYKGCLNNSTINNNFFLSIGRQIPKKNLLFLLEAYSIYRKKVGNEAYDLILIGDGPERKNIQDYINYNHVKGVILLPFLQQKDLVLYYKMAKSFIICSKQDETWGLVINESLACGCPVIASNRCGAAESLIKDNVNGYIFNPFKTDELVNKMMCIHELSKEQWISMSNNSLRTIEKWDTRLFAKSSLDAIRFVSKRHNKKTNLLDILILNFWKGRYNPI